MLLPTTACAVRLLSVELVYRLSPRAVLRHEERQHRDARVDVDLAARVVGVAVLECHRARPLRGRVLGERRQGRTTAQGGHGIRRARIRKKVDAPSATGGVLDDGSVLHRRWCTERLRCRLGHACALGERVPWHEDDDCEHQTIQTQPFAHEDVLSRRTRGVP